MSDDLEELKRKTQRGDRNDEVENELSRDFVDEIVEAIEDVDCGDRPKTIAVRDRPIAALLVALDESDDEMKNVGHALEECLGRDLSTEFDRSEIARLAFRVGLETVAPEKMAELSDAIGRHAQQNL